MVTIFFLFIYFTRHIFRSTCACNSRLVPRPHFVLSSGVRKPVKHQSLKNWSCACAGNAETVFGPSSWHRFLTRRPLRRFFAQSPGHNTKNGENFVVRPKKKNDLSWWLNRLKLSLFKHISICEWCREKYTILCDVMGSPVHGTIRTSGGDDLTHCPATGDDRGSSQCRVMETELRR